jgi:hypothetical protein
MPMRGLLPTLGRFWYINICVGFFSETETLCTLYIYTYVCFSALKYHYGVTGKKRYIDMYLRTFILKYHNIFHFTIFWHVTKCAEQILALRGEFR